VDKSKEKVGEMESIYLIIKTMHSAQIAKACQWFQTEKGQENPEPICSFRDIFQARLDTLYAVLIKKKQDPSAAALITALLGEVGNNSFDHNLGQWRDTPGCWFEYGFEKNCFWALIADRGRGMHQSLKLVEPNLKNDQQAIETAFTKVISGRFPEKRGNGLKFVSGIMNHAKPRGLFCLSGEGMITLGQKGEDTKKVILPHIKQKQDFGTLTFICWEK
jgi:hypothetical protein